MADVALKLTKWRGTEVLAAVDGKLARNMRPAVAVLETEVKRSLKGGGAPHVPSLPGEPPRVDTGAYRARIYSDVSISPRRVVGRIISPSRQALALEFGYPPGGLAARPHLRPALARVRIEIYRTLVGSSRVGPASLSEIRGAVALTGGGS